VATGTLAPLGAASYPVFVHRPAVSLPASSPRLVTLSQLQFASFGMVSFRGDFHPQDDVHAGRTRSAAGGRLRPTDSFNGMFDSPVPRDLSGSL